jgi:N-terminal domain of galactosyltransferase
MKPIRQFVGASVLDLPRTLATLRRPEGWVNVTNRLDNVSRSSDPIGIRCHSDSTSSLHVCDVFPSVGRRLLRNVLQTWRFEMASRVKFSESPTFSFVIPHRGTQRQPLLEATIRSIASLPGDVECIVVEQDFQPRLSSLPGNVRHLHASHPTDNERWHKCFAFNIGVQEARGEIVICHDGDILVPTNYLDVIREHLIQREQDVVFPQRFLFYLNQSTTKHLLKQGNLSALANTVPEMVKQNWTGGTLAITKQAYKKVGGFDEAFTDWGGEDLEFYDRCKTLDGWFFGYVPFAHLWHPPQVGRIVTEVRQKSWEAVRSRLAVDRTVRVCELTQTSPR